MPTRPIIARHFLLKECAFECPSSSLTSGREDHDLVVVFGGGKAPISLLSGVGPPGEAGLVFLLGAVGI